MIATILKLLGAEASVGSSGSDFGGAKLVRIYNLNGSDVVVTVKDASANTTGTVTVKAGDTIFVQKTAEGTISAATACKMVGVAF